MTPCRPRFAPIPLAQQALQLIRTGQFNAAFLSIQQQLESGSTGDPQLLHLAGECCRFAGKAPAAVVLLTQATRLAPENTDILLALGQAYLDVLDSNSAIEVLSRAVLLNPNLVPGWNYLGLAQARASLYDEAIASYNNGLQALARSVAANLENSESSPVVKPWNSTYNLWHSLAIVGAEHLAENAGIAQTHFSNCSNASKLRKLKKSCGLYWRDDSGIRFYYPNYFHAFREALCENVHYAQLTGNKALVFRRMDDQKHYDQQMTEAREFAERVNIG